MRYEGLLKLIIIEGSVDGKDRRGRPTLDYVQQIKIKDQGRDSCVDVQIKRIADYRKEWKETAANRSTDWNYNEKERIKKNNKKNNVTNNIIHLLVDQINNRTSNYGRGYDLCLGTQNSTQEGNCSPRITKFK